MKIKFNWIDALIILLVICIAAVGVYFVAFRSDSEGTAGMADKNVKAELIFEVAQTGDFFIDLPKAGDSVLLGEKGKMPATVTDVRVEGAKAVGYDKLNGAAYWADVPDSYDVFITMEADAVDTEKDITIDGTPIKVGQRVAAASKNWAAYGYMLGVDVEGGVE